VPDDAFKILKLRAELVELGSAIRQLNISGLDSATAQLLMSRKRAELEDLMSLLRHSSIKGRSKGTDRSSDRCLVGGPDNAESGLTAR
jgi:hypothetical protein